MDRSRSVWLAFLASLVSAACSDSEPRATGNGARDAGGGTSTGGATGSDGSGGTDGGANPDAPATGGANGSGGTSAGSGGSGGSTGGVSGDGGTAEQACSAWAGAFCSHFLECAPATFKTTHGTLQSCSERLARFCPDELGAADSALTPGALATCAQALSAASCADGVLRPIQGCIVAGSRQNGTSCRYDSQCATAFCNRGADTWCGVCEPKAGLGAACNPNRAAACEPGLQCSSSGMCVMPLAAGAPCQQAFDCAPGLACTGTSTRSCTPGAKLDQPCQSIADCDSTDDLYCDNSTHTCQALGYAEPGQSCNYSNGVFCAALGTCRGADGSVTSVGTCAAAAADSQPCSLTTSELCVAPALCHGGQCAPPAPAASCP